MSQVLKVYSVCDSKTKIFHPPHYSRTEPDALRSFQQLINDERSTLNQFTDDFDLYYLGEYYDDTGKFDLLDTPQHIVKAIQLKQHKKPELAPQAE